MNFARALHHIAEHGVIEKHRRAALARDTVYMPSELAARLLSRDLHPETEPHCGERLVWDATVLAGDRRSPAR